jgi:hypothetical protein
VGQLFNLKEMAKTLVFLQEHGLRITIRWLKKNRRSREFDQTPPG